MTWPFIPYTLPLLLAVLFAAVPAYAIWQRRRLPGALPLLCIVAAAAMWSALHILELISADANAKFFWYSFSYLARFAIPLPTLLFTAIFTGRTGWMTQQRVASLALLPATLLALLWTNGWHHWIFNAVELDSGGLLPMLAVSPGPAYVLLVLYGYGFSGAAILMLLDMLRRCGPTQRPQVGAILLAMLAPSVIAALVVAGFHAVSPADPTPLAVTFGAAALCLFYLNFRPRDIRPLARDAVMEEMGDGIIVLDAQQRVVDCNGGATRILDCMKDAILSRSISDVVFKRPGWADAFCTEGTHTATLAHGEGDTCRYYDLTCSPLLDWQQRQVGQVAVLRDVTERRRTEETLRANERTHRELLAAEQRQSQEMRLIEQARTALAQEMDLRAVIRTVVEAAAQMFGYTQVSAYLLEGDELALQHYVGYTTVFWRIPLSSGINGRVGRTGAPVLLPDVRAAPDYMAAHAGVVSEVCVPLFDRGEVAGTFNVESSNGVVLGEADLRLLLALSEHVNFAITRARLYAQVRESESRYKQRAAEMTALYETMSAITSQRDLPVLLHSIVERATQLLGNNSGGLYLCDPLHHTVRCVVSINTVRDYTGVTMRYGEGAAGIVAQTGKPLNIEDYSVWSGRAAVYEQDSPFKAVLNVPMIWQGQVSGVLTVNASDRQFSQADVELLTLFADQATVAVENARLLDEVQRLAITDHLTGIYNRRHLFELGARELLRAQRFSHPLSVLMIDIDRFKQVNDRHGHAAGDQVLREIAQHCAHFIREFDVLARYGGEEFALLLPETDARGAQQLSERLRTSIAARVVPAGGAEVQVTISLGVAMSNGGEQSFEQLLDLADRALFAAKQAGRNRVELSAVLQ